MSVQANKTSTNAEGILHYAESVIVEDEFLTTARETAADIGVGILSPAAGATLAVLARLGRTKTAVEVGVGAGVSELWLLSGMREDGTLTIIDADPIHHQATKAALTHADTPPHRVRFIAGHPTEVLPRLTDRAYDLVLINEPVALHPFFTHEGIRLLRPGGVIIIHHALAGAQTAGTDSAHDDIHAARETIRLITAHEDLQPVILPVGDGLLVAVKAHSG